MPLYDVIIIGGGIVGLSTAMALAERYPKARLLLLEKEGCLASHQTGRNSGVIHSGIYYSPGSLKAAYAKEGNQALLEFCRRHGIRHEVCGKVIVATDPEELPLLERLHQRGLANGLQIRRLSPAELKEIEPHCVGLAALQVPSTGIVNYTVVAEAFAQVFRERGGDVRLNAKVQQIVTTPHSLIIETPVASFETRLLVNCAGLQCDRIARLMGVKTGVQIVPIRGEYFMLRQDKRHLVKHLIYPVPNPRYPFLGVHLTRTIAGGVHAGPNAVVSLKREGYNKTDFNLPDSMGLATSLAFWRFAARNWAEGVKEGLRSLSKARFARSLQKLVPEIAPDDLVEPHAGVRAQALYRNGQLVDDFLLVPGPRSMHVCNAPSPAATASIPIGRAVAEALADVEAIPGIGYC